MDLNKLLYHHQRALIDGADRAVSDQSRRWAGLSAAYYARQIAATRTALGRDDPFTTCAGSAGISACG